MSFFISLEVLPETELFDWFKIQMVLEYLQAM